VVRARGGRLAGDEQKTGRNGGDSLTHPVPLQIMNSPTCRGRTSKGYKGSLADRQAKKALSQLQVKWRRFSPTRRFCGRLDGDIVEPDGEGRAPIGRTR